MLIARKKSTAWNMFPFLIAMNTGLPLSSHQVCGLWFMLKSVEYMYINVP